MVAPALIGCCLVKRQPNGELLWGVIVETEAYSQEEPACHGYNYRSPKNETLFGQPGRLYVYVCYGIHHCVNIVTGKANWANGVLLRAIALPKEHERIASGPGLLAKRFGFNKLHDNCLLSNKNEFWVTQNNLSKNTMQRIMQTTRIGISKGENIQWRWYLQNSRSISKRAKGDRCPSKRSAWEPNSNQGP